MTYVNAGNNPPLLFRGASTDIRENRTLSALDIIERIQNEVIAFAGKQPQFDDISLFVLKAQ